MPYRWIDHPAAPDRSGAVFHELVAWPHRSLPRVGFVWFIAVTAGLLLLPLLPLIGTPILWGILPFMVVAVAGVWVAITRTWRSGETRELLRFDASRLELVRLDPGQPERRFEANPYWLRVALRDGPVEDYLTLATQGREVELGAFLTPEERRELDRELRHRLAALREEGRP